MLYQELYTINYVFLGINLSGTQFYFSMDRLYLSKSVVNLTTDVEKSLLGKILSFFLLRFGNLQLHHVQTFINKSCINTPRAEKRNFLGLIIIFLAILIQLIVPPNVMGR